MSTDAIFRPYERLSTPCDCSVIALEEAAMRVGPAFIYDLFVHPKNLLWVKKLCDAASSPHHPFAPHIAITQHEGLRRFEWYLSANGRACGSEGVE